MKKRQTSREGNVSFQEKDLRWVKGSSGYSQTSGREDPTPDPDPNSPGGGQ
jgi:hypothetical protein